MDRSLDWSEPRPGPAERSWNAYMGAALRPVQRRGRRPPSRVPAPCRGEHTPAAALFRRRNRTAARSLSGWIDLSTRSPGIANRTEVMRKAAFRALGCCDDTRPVRLRRARATAGVGRHRPGSHPAAAPDETLFPTVNVAPVEGWPAGAKPTPAPGLAGRRLRRRPRSSALALCPAQRRRAGRRDQRAAAPGGRARASGAGSMELLHGQGRRRRAERRTASPCCATPTATAPWTSARCSSRTCTRRSAWRWSATTSMSPTPMRWCAFRTRRARPRSPARGEKVVDLPAGPINHHWTKNLIASPDGTLLYATVGSNSNVAENGITAERDRAAIWQIDPATGRHRVFASGLRNPNGMAWEPETGVLWTVVNERDEIGSDLVPDYLTSVKDGGFYGWPYSYFGDHVDERVAAAAARPGGAGDRAGLRARRAHGIARARPSPRATACRRPSRAAPSSASTAPGTAIRTAATRSSSCRSRAASPPASRSTC